MPNATRLSLVLIAAVSVLLPARGECLTRNSRADILLRRALHTAAAGTPEARRAAREKLEEAHALVPARADVSIALIQLCLKGDLLHRAANLCQDVLTREPGRADAECLLGEVRRRQWQIEGDDGKRDEAIGRLARAVRLAPANEAAWVSMLALLADASDVAAAYTVAATARSRFPRNLDLRLLFASAAQRAGHMDIAAQAFADVMPCLAGAQRVAFQEPGAVLPPWVQAGLDTASAATRAGFFERFWRDADPDPVTPWNEAHLEFWTRATQAWFLYRLPGGDGWDARGDLLVRFGHPAWSERNSVLRPDLAGRGCWLLWAYPEYGMRVWMEATNPLSAWREPFTRWARPAVPYADSIRGHPEWATIAGWSVFPALPPGTSPLPVCCLAARFESDAGGRLLVLAEAPGSPGDRLSAEWVVLDSSAREVFRAARDMAPSACNPMAARTAEFAAALAPGRYRVGIAVENSDRARGVWRDDVVIEPHGDAMTLSDVVLTCGAPNQHLASGPGLRIDPDPRQQVGAREDLVTYYEIYRLAPDSTRRSTFEASYRVRPDGVAARGSNPARRFAATAPAPFRMTREDATIGSLRRQFVTVPLGSLRPGRYRLEVEVRDVRTGARAKGEVSFERLALAAAGTPAESP